MKKYQSSYVLKQIKKKRIFEKKSIWIFHMDFPSNLTPVIGFQFHTPGSKEDILSETFLGKPFKLEHVFMKHYAPNYTLAS